MLPGYFVFFVVSINVFPANAQKFIWGKHFPGLELSGVNVLVPSENHDLFVVGGFYHQVNIDQVTLTCNLTDGFFARMDSAGLIKWAKRIGATHHGGVSAAASDKDGNLFVSGNFDDRIELPNGTLQSPDPNAATYFVIKYSAEGEFVWSKLFLETYIPDLQTDEDGNIYVMIYDFPMGVRNPVERWINKYDKNGSLVKRFFIGSVNPALGYMGVSRFAVSRSGYVFVLGETNGEAVVGDQQWSSGFEKVYSFLTQFNPNGEMEWAKKMGVQPYNNSQGTLVADAANNCYVLILLGDDSIITKFDPEGAEIWKLIPEYNGDYENDSHNFYMLDAALDEKGNLLIAGNLQGLFRSNGIQLSSLSPTAVLMKCSTDGKITWATNGLSASGDFAESLMRSPISGSIFLGGTQGLTETRFGNVILPGPNNFALGFVVKAKDPQFTSPLVNLGSDQTLCIGQNYSIHAGKYFSYQWQNGSTDSTFIATTPGKYYVTVTDFLGNNYTDTLNVRLCLEQAIPNIITPNGDPKNEYFVIENLDLSAPNILTISDRWGKQVFVTNSYQNNWNGDGLVNGIYYYQLITAFDQKRYKGWVQIMR